MRYLDYILEPNEIVLCRAHRHWWFNLRSGGLHNVFNHFLVTDRRVLEKTGIFAARTRSLALSQIESKDVEQSLWGRVFGFGDLLLHGAGGKEVCVRNLADPNGIARIIGHAALPHRLPAKAGAPP
jgi:hypothetical protein